MRGVLDSAGNFTFKTDRDIIGARQAQLAASGHTPTAAGTARADHQRTCRRGEHE